VIRSMTSMVRAGGATQQVGCFGAIWARSSAEQTGGSVRGALPASVGKEAEVADADQAFGQNVKKKLRRNSSAETVMTFCLPPWHSLASGRRRDRSRRLRVDVGDGDAMSVAGQVVENVFGAAERWLGVDDPVLPEQLPQKVGEASGSSQILLRAMN